MCDYLPMRRRVEVVPLGRFRWGWVESELVGWVGLCDMNLDRSPRRRDGRTLVGGDIHGKWCDIVVQSPISHDHSFFLPSSLVGLLQPNAMLCSETLRPSNHKQLRSRVRISRPLLRRFSNPSSSCAAHQDIVHRNMYQLNHITNHTHNQETHPDCLADAQEFALVRFATSRNELSAIFQELPRHFQ